MGPSSKMSVRVNRDLFHIKEKAPNSFNSQCGGATMWQDEAWVLLDGEGGAWGRAGPWAARWHTGGMDLWQVVPGRLCLQGQLQMKILCHRSIHDATCQDVRQATVVTGASGGKCINSISTQATNTQRFRVRIPKGHKWLDFCSHNFLKVSPKMYRFKRRPAN